MFRMILRSGNVEGSGGAPDAAPDADARIAADIDAIMNFDPFGPSEETPPAASAEPTPVSSPVPEQAPEQPAAPAPTPQVDPLLEAAQALRTTAEVLPQVVREAAQPPPRVEPEQDVWAPVADGQQLNYGAIFQQLPEAMIAGLGSENPAERKQSIAALLATSTHLAHRLAVKQAVETMRQEFARAIPNYVRGVITEHSTQQEVYSDFYGKFPTLSRPELRPLVMQQAQVLARQLGVQKWTPEFRDRLGEHVVNMLRGVVPVTAPAVQPAPQMSGPSVRPPAQSVNGPAQEMWDLLN